jgi:hypothetical protein
MTPEERRIGKINEGGMSKGGQNIVNMNSPRPPVPQGSGGTQPATSSQSQTGSSSQGNK